MGEAKGVITQAQKEALGELILSIEARSGNAELVAHDPWGVGLLAHRD